MLLDKKYGKGQAMIASTERAPMKAWLVTWEWTGEHAAVTQPVASILDPRTGAGTVRQRVEQLYADSQYSLSERLALVRDRRSNPYPAKFDSVPPGVTYEGRITCGHNPFLYGRLVDDLKVECDVSGQERLVWKERPVPKIGIPGAT
jgi:hypothetical protein